MNLSYGLDADQLEMPQQEDVMNRPDRKRDPVCEMEVESETYLFEYMGNQYTFCSQQCLDRFEANPNLYIGKAGKASPKQLDKKLIRRRTLKLEHGIPRHVSDLLIQRLEAMMGIKEVIINKNSLDITYDLLEATHKQIENVIETEGHQLEGGLGQVLKQAFIHYFEECELDSLEQQGSDDHHCN